MHRVTQASFVTDWGSTRWRCTRDRVRQADVGSSNIRCADAPLVTGEVARCEPTVSRDRRSTGISGQLRGCQRP